MAGATNGQATGPTQKGSANGHAVPSRRVALPAKKKKSLRIFSTILRLSTWYSIISILLRCPATSDHINEGSPYVCKPYFNVRDLVVPHIEPYYSSYAASYVNAAQPFYETFDQKILTPISTVGIKYGAPRVAQAQAFGYDQWDTKLRPQAQRLQIAAQQKYASSLAPFVEKVDTSTAPYLKVAKESALQTYYGHVLPTYTSIEPYAASCFGLATAFASNTVLPSTKWILMNGLNFLNRTLLPQLRILYGENVEPQLLRIRERLGRYRDGKRVQALVDKVDGQTLISSKAPQNTLSTSTVASPQTSVLQSTKDSPKAKTSSEAPANTPLTQEQQIANAQKVVANDLKVWQEKFAKAADEGSDELDERVTELTDRLIRNQAEKVGSSLIIQLEEIVKSKLKVLKQTIIALAEKEDDSEQSEDALSAAVRKAGFAIKDKAQSVRSWRQNYDDETNHLVNQAAMDTLEILDSIQDLGLSEIGMRWAWTDGITHKDWIKYHKLKPKFDEWQRDVELVAIEHPGLENARAASEKIENQAMDIAEEAAKTLTQLRDIGRRKISAGDHSDDWSPKILPTMAEAAGQRIMGKVSEASEAFLGATTSSKSMLESLSSVVSVTLREGVSSASSLAGVASDDAESIDPSASLGVRGQPQGTMESVLSVASASASSMMDEASSTLIGTPTGIVESASSAVIYSADQSTDARSGISTGYVETAASGASKSLDSVLTKASSIVGEKLDVLEKASRKARSGINDASDRAQSLSDTAGSSILDDGGKASEAAYERSTSVTSNSSPESRGSSKVWGGAEAQFVEAREIIFDDIFMEDDDTYSAKISSIASQAGDNFADITKAVSEALLGTASTQGAAARVTSLAAEQYSSALVAASSALLGTEQAATDSIMSVVSNRYAEAVSSASVAIYGTPVNAPQLAFSAASSVMFGVPQGVVESMQSVAASRLSEGLSSASAYYQSAKDYVSAEPTPESVKDRMLSQAQAQYYAGIGLAHERYSEFITAASSAILPTQTAAHENLYNKASTVLVGTPTKFYEEPISAASSRFSDASVMAKSNLDAMLSSISIAGTKTSHPASSASSIYSVAIAEASSMLNRANLGLSSAVYGSETPYAESIASAASTNWEALLTAVSSQVYGAPTPTYIIDYVTSHASGAASKANTYASQATDAAVSQYSAVQSLISELVHGHEPAYTESVYQRLSSFYYTAAPAAASSASSYASDAFGSGSSLAASVFTPPQVVEDVLSSASSALNSAIEAASVQVYGTQKGSYMQASSSASSVYSSLSSEASERMYGTTTGYAEAAGSSISDAASSAQKAISEAIYGTSTGPVESATDKVKEGVASATDAASSFANEGYAKVSKAIYGEEAGAVESAQKRLEQAVESARARLIELNEKLQEKVGEAYQQASEGVEGVASSVSSAVGGTKDEL